MFHVFSSGSVPLDCFSSRGALHLQDDDFSWFKKLSKKNFSHHDENVKAGDVGNWKGGVTGRREGREGEGWCERRHMFLMRRHKPAGGTNRFVCTAL